MCCQCCAFQRHMFLAVTVIVHGVLSLKTLIRCSALAFYLFFVSGEEISVRLLQFKFVSSLAHFLIAFETSSRLNRF